MWNKQDVFANSYAHAATKSSIHAKYEGSISYSSMVMGVNIENRQDKKYTPRSTDAGEHSK